MRQDLSLRIVGERCDLACGIRLRERFMQCVVGMNNLAATTGFVVYPNPFKNSTSIEYNLSKTEKVTVEVYNAVGEKVETFAASELQGAGKHAYQFSGASTGIYTVKLVVGESSTVQKLVKMQ